jgi:hypothetical protein
MDGDEREGRRIRTRDDEVKEGRTSMVCGDGVSVFGLCYLITKINKSSGAGCDREWGRGAKRTEANYTITRQ